MPHGRWVLHLMFEPKQPYPQIIRPARQFQRISRGNDKVKGPLGIVEGYLADHEQGKGKILRITTQCDGGIGLNRGCLTTQILTSHSS